MVNQCGPGCHTQAAPTGPRFSLASRPGQPASLLPDCPLRPPGSVREGESPGGSLVGPFLKTKQNVWCLVGKKPPPPRALCGQADQPLEKPGLHTFPFSQNHMSKPFPCNSCPSVSASPSPGRAVWNCGLASVCGGEGAEGALTSDLPGDPPWPCSGPHKVPLLLQNPDLFKQDGHVGAGHVVGREAPVHRGTKIHLPGIFWQELQPTPYQQKATSSPWELGPIVSPAWLALNSHQTLG